MVVYRYLHAVVFISLAFVFVACSSGGGGGSGSSPNIPGVPANVSVLAVAGGLQVSWDNVSGASNYHIYLASVSGVGKENYTGLTDGRKISDVSTPYTVGNLNDGITYYVVVTAANAAGESAESQEQSAVATPVPGIPSGLKGSAVSGQLTLSWHSVPFADSYTVYYASEAGVGKYNYMNLVAGARVVNAVSPLAVSGLENEDTYHFVVTAVNTLGESAVSHELVAVPGTRGWFALNPLPLSADLVDAGFVDLFNGWLVGRGGGLLHTVDAGANWTDQWPGAAIDFTELALIDANNVWVLGTMLDLVPSGLGGYDYRYNSILLSTSDGGLSWQMRATPAVDLRSVDFISPQEGRVAGESGIYYTTDGGDSWQRQATFSASRLKFVDTQTGWAAWDSTLYRTQDAGLNWNTHVPAPYSLTAMDFVDADTGWYVSHNAGYQSLAGLYGSIDGGISWGALPTSLRFLTSVDFVNTSVGWITDIRGNIAHSVNGGASWNNQTSGVVQHLNTVTAIDVSNAWAVGVQGVILNTEDAGTTWNRSGQDSISGSSGLSAVDFVDANFGWAVGRAIVASSDGGSTWTIQMSGLTESLHDVDFINASTGWAVGDGAQIYYTNNGGATWSPQDNGGILQLWGVSFVDANHGWAVGPSGVIRMTNDGGTNWWPQTSGAGNHLHKVHFVDANNGWVAGAGGIILHTTDGGSNWLGQISGVSVDVSDIFALDVNRVWAVAGSKVLASNDGGAQWKELASLSMTLPRAVFFADTLNGWVLADNGTVFATGDGGGSWSRQSSGVTSPHVLRGLSFIDANTGWAVGGAGVGIVIKTTSGGVGP